MVWKTSSISVGLDHFFALLLYFVYASTKYFLVFVFLDTDELFYNGTNFNQTNHLL